MEVPRCPGNKLAVGIRLYTLDIFWWRPAKYQFSQMLSRIRERHQLQDTREARPAAKQVPPNAGAAAIRILECGHSRFRVQ